SEFDGYYVLLGYRIFKKIEAVIRFEPYRPTDGYFYNALRKGSNFLGVGLNYFFNKNIKIKANYIYNREIFEEPRDDWYADTTQLENNSFFLELQLSL
ncbi:MAG: hypothetical protein GY757_44855, partial [bacterium]|nr:hypothetical protein [bacterium]